jgi:hypothetical protein
VVCLSYRFSFVVIRSLEMLSELGNIVLYGFMNE